MSVLKALSKQQKKPNGDGNREIVTSISFIL